MNFRFSSPDFGFYPIRSLRLKLTIITWHQLKANNIKSAVFRLVVQLCINLPNKSTTENTHAK